MDMTGIDLTHVIAEFEAHRLGQEVEGSQYCDAEAQFFRDIVEGVVREQRRIDRSSIATLPKAGGSTAWIRSCAPSCAPALTRC